MSACDTLNKVVIKKTNTIKWKKGNVPKKRRIFLNYSKTTQLYVATLVLLLLLPGCSRLRMTIRPDSVAVPAVQFDKKKSANIRVALVKSAKRVRVSSFREVKIYDMRTKKVIERMRLPADTQIAFRDSRIMIAGKKILVPRIRIVPAEKEYLSVQGKRYRGQIEILINTKSGGLSVINYIPMEQYLLGVVPNEVVSTWPEQALQAQAVAARTFAMYKMSGRAREDYDLDASVNSQVYRGLDSEKDRTSQAVLKTRGIVAMSKGKYIAAFYHSNCGGHTTNVKDVWGSQMHYLIGSSCGFCDKGPHYRWEHRISKKDLEKRLKRKKIIKHSLQRLELIGRDSGGRVKTVRIHHSNGQRDIKAAAFRMAIGPDIIRSTKFYIRSDGNNLVFKGNGWGHGVGLCQEGALGMARSGYHYRDIIRHYYPGVDIHTVKISK
jgi:stage II sporulation protein D (peptidoglycan lytic transglycosylase)